jgi:hypothetical protein
MSHRVRVPRRDLPAPIGAIMVEVAAGFGIARPRCWRAPRSTRALGAPDTRISLRDQTRMLENCLRRSGDPGFALHFGSRISVAALGELGYALMCCRNVQGVMEVMGQYHRLISGSFRIEVESGRDAVSIRLVGGMLHDEAEPADCEIFFAAAAASLRQLCALSDDALSVTLAYPDPGYGEDYRRLICRDGLRRRQPAAVDRRYLDVPLQFANPRC